jgi:hypothetical protein
MRAIPHSILFAACSAAVLVAPIGTADAQQVQAGTLDCRGGPDAGFIVGPVTNLDRVLHVDGAPDRRYIAAIQNFSAFIGEQDVALSWKVMARTPWLGVDDLAGSYAHNDDAGASVLVGGSNGPIALSPLNEHKEGAADPMKIEGLEIRPMDR